MWLTSNTPTRSRTARCSSMRLLYSTGMSQPPKSTIFAPMLRCMAFKGVLRRGIPLLFNDGPNHVEAVVNVDVGGAAQAPDGVEPLRVDDHIFTNHTIANMEADHFANHHTSASGLVADLDDVEDFTFHIHRRFEHTRRLNEIAGYGRESANIELADVGSVIAGGQIHLLRDLLGNDVGHEFAGGLD